MHRAVCRDEGPVIREVLGPTEWEQIEVGNRREGQMKSASPASGWMGMASGHSLNSETEALQPYTSRKLVIFFPLRFLWLICSTIL